MYRTYITVGVIIFLLGAGGFWHSHYIQKSADSLVQRIDRLEEQILLEKWEDGLQEMVRIEEEWEDTKKWWSVLLHHQEIESIDITLKRAEKFVVGKNSLHGIGELSALRLLFEHISDTEILSLQNIL